MDSMPARGVMGKSRTTEPFTETCQKTLIKNMTLILPCPYLETSAVKPDAKVDEVPEAPHAPLAKLGPAAASRPPPVPHRVPADGLHRTPAQRPAALRGGKGRERHAACPWAACG